MASACCCTEEISVGLTDAGRSKIGLFYERISEEAGENTKLNVRRCKKTPGETRTEFLHECGDRIVDVVAFIQLEPLHISATTRPYARSENKQ